MHSQHLKTHVKINYIFVNLKNTCENYRYICGSEKHMRKLWIYLWIWKTHVNIMDIFVDLKDT